MSFKEKALAALEELKGDTTGIIAATIEDCQQVIRDIPEDMGWIPVKERLPETSGWYLVARDRHQMCVHYSPEHQMFNCHDTFTTEEATQLHLDCTHWMPLPKLPEED